MAVEAAMVREKVMVAARTDHQLEMVRVAPKLHTLDDMLQVQLPQ